LKELFLAQKQALVAQAQAPPVEVKPREQLAKIAA
jgi:hypothetical protein